MAKKEGVLTFVEMLAHHMRDMQPSLVPPNATPQERHIANLRYGNERAQRLIGEIKSRAKPESVARLLAIRASHLRRAANQTAKVEIRTPFGRHIDTDYVEELRQAAFVLRLEAYALRSAAHGVDLGEGAKQ